MIVILIIIIDLFYLYDEVFFRSECSSLCIEGNSGVDVGHNATTLLTEVQEVTLVASHHRQGAVLGHLCLYKLHILEENEYILHLHVALHPVCSRCSTSLLN